MVVLEDLLHDRRVILFLHLARGYVNNSRFLEIFLEDDTLFKVSYLLDDGVLL